MSFVGVGKVGLPRPSLREEVGVDVRVRSGRKRACYVCWSTSDSGTKDGRGPQRSANQTALWVLIVTWPSSLWVSLFPGPGVLGYIRVEGTG